MYRDEGEEEGVGGRGRVESDRLEGCGEATTGGK